MDNLLHAMQAHQNDENDQNVANQADPPLTPATIRPSRVVPSRPFLRRNVTGQRILLPPIDRPNLERDRARHIQFLRRKQMKLQRMINKIEELLVCTEDHLADLYEWKQDTVEAIGDLQYGGMNSMGFRQEDHSDVDSTM